MKTPLTILLLLCAVLVTSARAADDYVREYESSSEIFMTRVIKDLSFEDNGAEYVAYLVKWRDREVVVSAPMYTGKRHAVGDSIRCHMTRRNMFNVSPPRSYITFTLVPVSGPGDEARMKAVAEEVAARRTVREAQENGSRQK